MNKLIIGMELGENVNTEFLQNLAKKHNYKYIKIGGIDAAHMATVNNLNQAEYWARVYADAFENVRNGENVVLDMDYFQDADISELSVLAKDNGVLHIQGAMPSLKQNLDLLGGEKTVARVLNNEGRKIDGLDSIYIEDLNIEIIKNISSVSDKFIQNNVNVKLASDVNNFDKMVSGGDFLSKNWHDLVKVGYGMLGVILLGLIFWLGNNLWKKWQNTEEVKVVYRGQQEVKEETEFVNTNKPIFIEDIPQIEVVTESESLDELPIATTTEKTEKVVEEVMPEVKQEKKIIQAPSVKKYGRIKPEYLSVPYCCTDGTFKQWYNFIGTANVANLQGDVYYVKTNESVYAVNGAIFDRNGKMIGGNAFKIEGADPNTFYVLNDYLKVHNFARDDNHVYYKGAILNNMDPHLTLLYCPAGTLQSCFFNDGLYNYSMITGKEFVNNLLR